MMAPPADLRIFSYFPNPRVWNSTIAARLSGVTVELVGATSSELADWLWNFDARPVNEADRNALPALQRRARRGLNDRVLLKTDAFLKAHPFGTVPAAFSPDGRVGIFESNSIMRAVARLSKSSILLSGDNPYERSRVDSFLDASLLFSHDIQRYLLAMRSGQADPRLHEIAAVALEVYLEAIERALGHGGSNLVSEALTLADICFACDLVMLASERFYNSILSQAGLDPIAQPCLATTYPRSLQHFATLRQHPAFEADFAAYSDELRRPPFE